MFIQYPDQHGFSLLNSDSIVNIRIVVNFSADVTSIEAETRSDDGYTLFVGPLVDCQKYLIDLEAKLNASLNTKEKSVVEILTQLAELG